MSVSVLCNWTKLPLDGHTIEVPFQLRVGSFHVVTLYGLTLAKQPFHPGLPRYRPFIWAIWCAFETLYVQDVLNEWIHKLCSRLVADMREIGVQTLVMDGAEENILHHVLGLPHGVRWEVIDPTASTRPLRNYFGAPIFTSGDVVPFNQLDWELYYVSSVLCKKRSNLRRSNLCGPDLFMRRDTKCGNGIAPAGFIRPPHNGMRIGLMRVEDHQRTSSDVIETFVRSTTARMGGMSRHQTGEGCTEVSTLLVRVKLWMRSDSVSQDIVLFTTTHRSYQLVDRLTTS